MGLLKHVLFWPVTGPNFLIRFSLDKVEDTVREQLTDDQVIKEDLLALQMQVELGEVDDEEYMEREAALMQRLRDVRHWREEFGMGISGGPVRVSQTPDDSAAETEDAGAREEPEEDEPRSGGIATPGEATVEFNLDWD